MRASTSPSSSRVGSRWAVAQHAGPSIPRTGSRRRVVDMPNRSRRRPLHRRVAWRAAGLRAVKIRVPRIRRPGFAGECRRQARVTARADAADPELFDLLDRAFDDAS